MTVNSRPTTKSCAKRRALLLWKEEKQSREVINPGHTSWAVTRATPRCKFVPLAVKRILLRNRSTNVSSPDILSSAQRALSGNVFMGWDMNLEDRYREFVRLIRLRQRCCSVGRLYRVDRKWAASAVIYFKKKNSIFFLMFSRLNFHPCPRCINKYTNNFNITRYF